MKDLTKTEKTLYSLLALSVVIMVFGFLFLVNAMGIADFYPSYSSIPNALGKYLVVIATMACGMMLFSNVALRLPNQKQRNGLTIFITVFMFVLTAPLTYVLISLLPFAINHKAAEVFAAAGLANGDLAGMTPELVASSAEVMGLNAIDGIMGTHNIYLGFVDWFGEGGLMWAILVVMAIVGIVFLIEPVAAGYCVVKGKILLLFGKGDDGKFKLLGIGTLPILKKQAQEGCDGHCECCCHAAEEAEVAMDEVAEEAAADVEKVEE